MLYCVWLASLWVDLVISECGKYSTCMLDHVLNLFSQTSFTVFFLILTYSLPNNPMFDCVIFVNVCDFAEIKSIHKKPLVQMYRTTFDQLSYHEL